MEAGWDEEEEEEPGLRQEQTEQGRGKELSSIEREIAVQLEHREEVCCHQGWSHTPLRGSFLSFSQTPVGSSKKIRDGATASTVTDQTLPFYGIFV